MMIHWTFGVRCSEFNVSPLAYERFEIRLPPTAEESRLHDRGRPHARTGHRSHNGRVQPDSWRAVDTAALSKAGTDHSHLAGEDGWSALRDGLHGGAVGRVP